MGPEIIAYFVVSPFGMMLWAVTAGLSFFVWHLILQPYGRLKLLRYGYVGALLGWTCFNMLWALWSFYTLHTPEGLAEPFVLVRGWFNMAMTMIPFWLGLTMITIPFAAVLIRKNRLNWKSVSAYLLLLTALVSVVSVLYARPAVDFLEMLNVALISGLAFVFWFGGFFAGIIAAHRRQKGGK